MSSIRPLATITVLAFVGTFLYLKLTETEAELPEGVDSWAVEQDIQIDGDFGSPVITSPEISAPATSSGGAAPAFSASAPSAAPPFNANPGGEAPAFSAGASAPAFVAESTSPSQGTASSPEAAPEYKDVISVPPVVAATTIQNEATTVSSPENNVSVTIPDLPPLPEMSPATEKAATTPSNTPETLQTTLPPIASTNEPTPQATAPPMTSVPPTNPPITPAVPSITPPQTTSAQNPAQSSLFAATRLSVQAALDRGELSQALLLLSDWYGDPSLSAQEAQELQSLLSQLAGSVIYSMEPRLEAPHMVQAGETLMDIGQKYDIPWQLLAKINGIQDPKSLAPGRQLKVLRGPFSAVIDFSKRRMTLMLDRRYAGHFDIEIDPTISIEEGQWTVQQKPISPASAGYGTAGIASTEERSLILTSNGGSSQLAIIRSSNGSSTLAEPANRVIRLSAKDINDVYDILSRGSNVIIRR